MSKQYVFWLEITVNDSSTLQKTQRRENLLGKPSDESQGKPFKVVRLDELIQIHAQQFRSDTQMAPEVETVSEINHPKAVLRILAFALANYISQLNSMKL